MFKGKMPYINMSRRYIARGDRWKEQSEKRKNEGGYDNSEKTALDYKLESEMKAEIKHNEKLKLLKFKYRVLAILSIIFICSTINGLKNGMSSESTTQMFIIIPFTIVLTIIKIKQYYKELSYVKREEHED